MGESSDRSGGRGAELLNELKPILTKHTGNCQTVLNVPANGSKRATISLDRSWSVRATAAMKKDLEHTLNGHGRVEIVGDGAMRARRTQQQPLFQEVAVSAVLDDVPAMVSTSDDMEF